MVSKQNAQEIADILVAGRVKGIWNFAATDLNVPEKVALRDVHLSDTLHELAYYVTKR
jgi:redox-sensing transcriptional repressor